MPPFGFCGPCGTSRAASSDVEDLWDMYVEVGEAPGTKSKFQLIQRPGKKIFATLATSGIRGHYTTNQGTTAERFFAVSGNTLYELTSAAVATSRGTVANDSLPVSFAFNGTQLLIASGGILYLFTLATNVLSIPVLPFSEAVPLVHYIDGYFLALRAGTKSFNISGILDGSSWNGADFATVSVFPDNLISMGGDHRQLILHSGKKSIVYYNDGSASFPFSPVPGSGLIEMGAGSVFGGSFLDSTRYWWGQDENGAIMAYKLNGYSPQRISKEFVEFRVSQYSQWTDVESFALQISGHTFWINRFPSANETWVYDVKTGFWQKWSYFFQGKRLALRARCHAYAFGKHLVGDPNSGNIFEMNAPKVNGTIWDFADDAGAAIRRERVAPAAGSGLDQNDFWKKLYFIMDTGLGPIPALQGLEAPTVITMASPNGTKWDITITELGVLQANASVLNGAAQTVILNDNGNPATTSWQVTISNAGAINAPSSVTFSSAYPAFIRMVTQVGDKAYQLTVTSLGVLQQLNLGNVARGPQMMVSLCRDGNGKSFGNEFQMNCGQAGEYGKRVYKNLLGKSRGTNGLIVKAAMSDAVPWRVVEAILE
jgi:hypothetical protein